MFKLIPVFGLALVCASGVWTAGWADPPPTSTGGNSGALVFSLVRPLFEPLRGDPREPALGMTSYLNEAGFEYSFGGALDFARWRSAPDMEWGVGLFAGLWTLSENPDWSTLWVDDWFTGLYLSEKTGSFSFRLEFQDQKSDPGDALAKPPAPFYPFDPSHPQASRYYFTRDNQNLTVSWDALPGLRLYAGGGFKTWWDDFDPFESQIFMFGGMEAESSPFSFLGSVCRGYGTYHFKYQDQAGGTYDHAVQLGLKWAPAAASGSALRLALMFYSGHSEFGQFYQKGDQHWGIGIFFDP